MTVSTGTIILDSAFSQQGVVIKKKGEMVTGTIGVTNANALSAGSSYKIADIPSGYYPTDYARQLTCYTTGGTAHFCYVNTSGSLYIVPSIQIASGSSIRINPTYGVF